MKYISKTCPICGNEFVVLKSVEDKAVYCTLKCLFGVQNQMNDSEISSLMMV